MNYLAPLFSVTTLWDDFADLLDTHVSPEIKASLFTIASLFRAISVTITLNLRLARDKIPKPASAGYI
jgi:hypothetical protein